MSERVPAWAESDERYPEREAEWRAAIARAERAEAGLSRAIDVTNERDGLRFDLAAAIARAERAEAQLAALREAALNGARRIEQHLFRNDRAQKGSACRIMEKTLADEVPDIVAAAEAYRASVEAPLRAEATRAVLAATAESYEARRAAEAERDTLRAEIERITARHDRRLAVIDDVRVALASPDGEDIRVAARRVVAERDAYAALDCSVQHDADRAALGVASLRAERAERERDTLAAALAEVRRVILDGRAAVEVAVRDKGQTLDVVVDAAEAGIADLDRVLTALPADLAADAFRRVRAEALEAAADAIERGSVLSQYGAHGWLRARAADERGGR